MYLVVLVTQSPKGEALTPASPPWWGWPACIGLPLPHANPLHKRQGRRPSSAVAAPQRNVVILQPPRRLPITSETLSSTYTILALRRSIAPRTRRRLPLSPT